jgi:hypothetical protein
MPFRGIRVDREVRTLIALCREDTGEVSSQFYSLAGRTARRAEAGEIPRRDRVLRLLFKQLPATESPVKQMLISRVIYFFIYGGAAREPWREQIADRLLTVAKDSAQFVIAWHKGSPGEAVAPLPTKQDDYAEVFDRVSGELGPKTQAACTAWLFELEMWLLMVYPLLLTPEGRQSLPKKDLLRQTIGALRHVRLGARLVNMLLRTLDDEPIIVLDRRSGRGWRGTLTGVAANTQLHTLLAARLASQAPAGEPEPIAAQIAAAIDGDPQVETESYVRLTDVDGKGIDISGMPADIPLYADERIIVVHRPHFAYAWPLGRILADMHPALTLDRELPPTVIADWLAHIPRDGHRQ